MGTYHCSAIGDDGKYCNEAHKAEEAKELEYVCKRCGGEVIMFGKDWIQEHSPQFLSTEYPRTMRGLHYKLVDLGFPNTIPTYKRVIQAMTDARWSSMVEFEVFEDHERETVGDAEYEETDLESQIEKAKAQIQMWIDDYSKNRWEGQPYYVEAWCEKKAQQGNFQRAINGLGVIAFACKGYPSLTWLNEAAKRFTEAQDAGKDVVIVYFGDYDPSGEDIPRSLEENICEMGVDITVDRILLLEQQVIDWGLPPAPTKVTDSRSRTWDGLGQVEMDAVDDSKMRQFVIDAIDKYFDDDIYNELCETEIEEGKEFREKLAEYVKELADEMDN